MKFDWLNSHIVEETIELVLVFNKKGEILFGNRTAEEKLEYKKEELLTTNMSQIFRQEFQKADGGNFDFDKEKLTEKKETAMYRKNSSCFSVYLKVFPYQGEEIFYLLAEDITIQKETDARIRKLKEEEENNSKARNEFTANVTHELRTPVNGIRGHVMTLLDTVKNEEQRKTLEVILYCCNNMSAIINNILDFSKMEAGKFTIEEKEFDFYQMVDRVIATHLAEINKKELRFHMDLDESIPRFLIGDELRLNQVLNNILSNAIKFTTVGYIDVAINKTVQLKDEVELFFMVKDSGIGISRKEQDKLFESFTQADASITRRFGGTGLGLTITKQLVELMHGNIHVESEKGKGSTFSFFVKLKMSQNVEENEKQREVYQDWNNFTREENEESIETLYQFGGAENKLELKKRMDKLVLSIELGAWDKAELLAETIKTLIEKGDEGLKRQVLRMEMAIRKGNYEKSMETYQKVKEQLAERLGEL